MVEYHSRMSDVFSVNEYPSSFTEWIDLKQEWDSELNLRQYDLFFSIEEIFKLWSVTVIDILTIS